MKLFNRFRRKNLESILAKSNVSKEDLEKLGNTSFELQVDDSIRKKT